jgi:hypothetical protein
MYAPLLVWVKSKPVAKLASQTAAENPGFDDTSFSAAPKLEEASDDERDRDSDDDVGKLSNHDLDLAIDVSAFKPKSGKGTDDASEVVEVEGGAVRAGKTALVEGMLRDARVKYGFEREFGRGHEL